MLRYFDDLTVPDVAAHLGLAEGSVKRYLSNAIGKLEQRLGPMPSARASGTRRVPITTRPGGRG